LPNLAAQDPIAFLVTRRDREPGCVPAKGNTYPMALLALAILLLPWWGWIALLWCVLLALLSLFVRPKRK